MKMNTMAVVPTSVLLSSIISAAPITVPEKEERSRESFNEQWKFARFGPMPDGSTKVEPGGKSWLIQATASSSEMAKNNVPANALDGEDGTRWCAANDKAAQWLKIDLEKIQSLSAMKVAWEDKGTYNYVIESSPDGKTWTVVVDRTKNKKRTAEKVSVNKAKFIRIRTLKLPKRKWASIKDVVLYDKDDKVIVNEVMKSKGEASSSKFNDTKWRTLNLPTTGVSKVRFVTIFPVEPANFRGRVSVGTASILPFLRPIKENAYLWTSTVPCATRPSG